MWLLIMWKHSQAEKVLLALEDALILDGVDDKSCDVIVLQQDIFHLAIDGDVNK